MGGFLRKFSMPDNWVPGPQSPFHRLITNPHVRAKVGPDVWRHWQEIDAEWREWWPVLHRLQILEHKLPFAGVTTDFTPEEVKDFRNFYSKSKDMRGDAAELIVSEEYASLLATIPERMHELYTTWTENVDGDSRPDPEHPFVEPGVDHPTNHGYHGSQRTLDKEREMMLFRKYGRKRMTPSEYRFKVTNDGADRRRKAAYVKRMMLENATARVEMNIRRETPLPKMRYTIDGARLPKMYMSSVGNKSLLGWMEGLAKRGIAHYCGTGAITGNQKKWLRRVNVPQVTFNAAELEEHGILSSGTRATKRELRSGE